MNQAVQVDFKNPTPDPLLTFSLFFFSANSFILASCSLSLPAFCNPLCLCGSSSESEEEESELSCWKGRIGQNGIQLNYSNTSLSGLSNTILSCSQGEEAVVDKVVFEGVAEPSSSSSSSCSWQGYFPPWTSLAALRRSFYAEGRCPSHCLGRCPSHCLCRG